MVNDISADARQSAGRQCQSCGFIQCTCDRFPRIVHVNDRMLDMLCVNAESADWREFLAENIYFIIPPEDRDVFRACVEETLETHDPVPLSHGLLVGEGSIILVQGMMQAVTDADGASYLNLLYLETSRLKKHFAGPRDHSYLNALKSAYGVIFEVNMDLGTVECIHGKSTSDIGALFDARMTIESAKYFWLNNFILASDRPMMKEYFDKITTSEWLESGGHPLQATFEMRWNDGVVYKFMGVAVCLDAGVSLFCCRDVTDIRYVPEKFQSPVSMREEGVFIRTFGYFDVFYNGKPLLFSSAKEKELMALLVDRNGGSVTSAEAIALLWEDEPASEKVKARYRKLLFNLKNTLAKYGIEDILRYARGARCVDTSKVTCDLYEYLAGNEEYRSAFRNAYMSGYSWAEQTLGALWI